MADIEKEKGSNKKPGPAKCRGCGSIVDLNENLIIGGNKWHRACAEEKKKYIPKEYIEA